MDPMAIHGWLTPTVNPAAVPSLLVIFTFCLGGLAPPGVPEKDKLDGLATSWVAALAATGWSSAAHSAAAAVTAIVVHRRPIGLGVKTRPSIRIPLVCT
jgi:hypothetical protein